MIDLISDTFKEISIDEKSILKTLFPIKSLNNEECKFYEIFLLDEYQDYMTVDLLKVIKNKKFYPLLHNSPIGPSWVIFVNEVTKEPKGKGSSHTIYVMGDKEKFSRIAFNNELCTYLFSILFIRGIIPYKRIEEGKDFTFNLYIELYLPGI